MLEYARHGVPESGTPFDDIVLHGGGRGFRSDRFDPERGAYFTSDPAYAADWGRYVYRCRVRLLRPVVYDERQSNSVEMEIDRRVLIGQGYDGRIIVYNDRGLDVIAFYSEQIKILDIGRLPKPRKGR